MKEYAQCDQASIIFDGTSFVNGARTNPFTQKGYTPAHKGKTQIRLIYAFNRKSKMPLYFMVAPGNISDKTAFSRALEEIDVKNCTIILDKGFFSKVNIELMADLYFVIALMKNTTLVPKELKAFLAYEKFLTNSFSYHKRLIYFTEVPQLTYKNCRLYVFYDCERRQYLMESYFRKLEAKHGAVLPQELMGQIALDTAGFGVSMLLTSLGVSASQVYLDYKARWEIEAMFNAHKNTLGFDMCYEASYSAQEGWSFIEFLSLLIYHKINSLLCEKGLIKTFNVKDILFRVSTVTQSKASGIWKVCNMSQPLMDIFKKLDVTIDAIPQ
jgi:transposase